MTNNRTPGNWLYDLGDYPNWNPRTGKMTALPPLTMPAYCVATSRWADTGDVTLRRWLNVVQQMLKEGFRFAPPRDEMDAEMWKCLGGMAQDMLNDLADRDGIHLSESKVTYQ